MKYELSRKFIYISYFSLESSKRRTGFDENYVISRNNVYGTFTKHFAARVEHKKTGRFVEIYSNQPGLRFYTGRFFTGRFIGD